MSFKSFIRYVLNFRDAPPVEDKPVKPEQETKDEKFKISTVKIKHIKQEDK